MDFEIMSDSVSLLYSQLLQLCIDEKPVLPDTTFIKKTIKNKKYWYSQVMVGGIKKQQYIGPDTKEIKDQIKQSKQINIERERLVSMLIQGGAITITNTIGKILENISYSGIFQSGGILGGSHAFSVYGNMLGINWKSALTRTSDIDIMREYDPIQINVEATETVWKENLIPLPNLPSNSPSTKFRIENSRDITLEFLTPATKGNPSSKPIFIKQLNTYAEPVQYLQYLFYSIQPAVFAARSGILVNVPNPAHYAIHKLAVAVRRHTAFTTKIKKDIAQAQALFSYLLETRPGDIHIAWTDAEKKMPKKFTAHIKKGMKLLKPKLQSELKKAIKK